MKKTIILILIIFLFNFSSFSDNIYSSFNYTRTATEPIVWYPESNIYYNDIYISLSSEYGKIFYMIGNDFGTNEPKEYTNEIALTGRSGSIIDYEIVAILEKKNGIIEIYSRTYRIDKTNKYKKQIYKDKEYFKSREKYIKDKLKIDYEFFNNEYGIKTGKREFVFPQDIQSNKKNKKSVILPGKNLDEIIYMVGVTYEKDGKSYTEIQNQTINLKKTRPPSFGSLYWGQIYKQSYEIVIKPSDSEDKIYYWYREWQNEELIVGPPLRTKIENWKKYKGAIELNSSFGKNGIIGVAAFSVGKNGSISENAGPYYFKVIDTDDTFEQVFEMQKTTPRNEKIVTINDTSFENKLLKFNTGAKLKFKNFDNDDRFYFTFKNKLSEGKSDLFPCKGEYVFKNIDDVPVDFKVFLSNGEKVAEYRIIGEKMILPVMRKYTGNYVNLSENSIIEFYMPFNKVKYEASSNDMKYLNITEDSPDFTGSIKLEAKEDEERSFKIKFGAFDKDGNLVGVTDDYYYKIDRNMPKYDVTADGVDLRILHNEKQVLKLIPPERESKVYYRTSSESDWILYEKPINFYPPSFGKYSIKVYCKSVDEAGNERANIDPYELRFDTRAIFVDSTKKYSGNGTEYSPFNSIEKAIQLVKLKNLKLIYLVSDENDVSFPMKIESDIIIEPYRINSKPEINMLSKSLWRKKHVWFDVTPEGFLEIRNIDFKIRSGNIFNSITRSKAKFYNLNILYKSTDDILFFNNNGGKLGINNLDLNVMNYPQNVKFTDTNESQNIMKNIKINVTGEDILFFNIIKTKHFSLEEMFLEIKAKKSGKFANIEDANAQFFQVIYKQTGDFLESTLFTVENSNLYVEESDYIVEGNDSFEIKCLEQKNSESKIIQSLFWIVDAASVIGFHSLKSDLEFERSIINVQDILDYVYNFRSENGNLKVNSSIIRNHRTINPVSFMLNDVNFEGANNSIFNVKVAGRGFNFWVTNKAEITTVNSLYYFDEIKDNNAFIYLNNMNYDLIKPVWLSNVFSSNVVLLENLEKKDAEYIIKDFTDKNIYYKFDNDFRIEAPGFFIPLKDSPLLQGGLSEYLSPIRIPEKDFFGRNRIIHGVGIDIGAVQKSGNF